MKKRRNEGKKVGERREDRKDRKERKRIAFTVEKRQRSTES